MQRPKTVEAVHTGYIIKINKIEQKKNIGLFGNVLVLYTQKVCKIKMLLNSFFMLPLII